MMLRKLDIHVQKNEIGTFCHRIHINSKLNAKTIGYVFLLFPFSENNMEA